MASVTIPGIGSGIDGSKVARSLFDQLTVSNEIRSNSIQQLERENSSLDTLRTRLLDVSAKLDSLRSVNGGAAVRTAASSDSAVVTAAAGSTSSNGSFGVQVQSLARPASASFDASFSNGKEFLISSSEAAGSLQFNIGSGDNVQSFSIAIDQTTTADDLVTAFNTAAGEHASARLLNIGSEANPDFRISFSTSSLGTAKGSLSISTDNQALLGDTGLKGSTIEQATNAQFTVSGISGTVNRESNLVSDVIPGVTLELKGIGNAIVSVSQNTQAQGDKLAQFVDAFNALAKFATEEDAITQETKDGEPVNKFGSLARTDVDDSALSQLRSAFASASSADASLSLASLGVRTEQDGTLSFDREVFDSVFAKNAPAATAVLTSLADKVGGVGGVVEQFTGFARTIDNTIRGNEAEIETVGKTIARVEQSAAQREQSVLLQFSRLDGLMAQLNKDAQFLQQLFQF